MPIHCLSQTNPPPVKLPNEQVILGLPGQEKGCVGQVCGKGNVQGKGVVWEEGYPPGRKGKGCVWQEGGGSVCVCVQGKACAGMGLSNQILSELQNFQNHPNRPVQPPQQQTET